MQEREPEPEGADAKPVDFSGDDEPAQLLCPATGAPPCEEHHGQGPPPTPAADENPPRSSRIKTSSYRKRRKNPAYLEKILPRLAQGRSSPASLSNELQLAMRDLVKHIRTLSTNYSVSITALRVALM